MVEELPTVRDLGYTKEVEERFSIIRNLVWEILKERSNSKKQDMIECLNEEIFYLDMDITELNNKINRELVSKIELDNLVNQGLIDVSELKKNI